VLDAISKDGFVPGARRVWKGVTDDSDDYHTEMCAKIWLEWFRQSFLENEAITGKWVVCIDNAAYHSSRVNYHLAWSISR